MSESYYQENNMLKEVKICYLIIPFIKLSDVKIQTITKSREMGRDVCSEACGDGDMECYCILIYIFFLIGAFSSKFIGSLCGRVKKKGWVGSFCRGSDP